MVYAVKLRWRTVFFFGNFGSEIQIGNQQVLGKNWGLIVGINKFSVMNLAKKGPKLQV
jgi:hypothetical protein